MLSDGGRYRVRIVEQHILDRKDNPHTEAGQVSSKPDCSADVAGVLLEDMAVCMCSSLRNASFFA